jgi:hypothetical protein
MYRFINKHIRMSLQAATRMRLTGVETQQGYLRMRSVKSIEISSDEKYNTFYIHMCKIVSFNFFHINILIYCLHF